MKKSTEPRPPAKIWKFKMKLEPWVLPELGKGDFEAGRRHLIWLLGLPDPVSVMRGYIVGVKDEYPRLAQAYQDVLSKIETQSAEVQK